MIEMHVNSDYPLFNAESRSRWFLYPSVTYPNYYYAWVIPDGNIHGTTSFSTYQSMILNRMNIPASIRINMWGNYNPTTRTGTIYARYCNETPYPLVGNVLFVITEDSLYYTGPNGDPLHNFVARDYIPNHIGIELTIPGNDSVTYSQPFTISSNWNANRCEIVTFFQSTRLAPDSTIEMYQGGKIKVRDLPLAIEEPNNNMLVAQTMVNVSPNPCIDHINFAFSLLKDTEYKISIFNISGSEVKELNGIAKGNKDFVRCDMKGVNTGVYFYRFVSEQGINNGKIIVK